MMVNCQTHKFPRFVLSARNSSLFNGCTLFEGVGKEAELHPERPKNSKMKNLFFDYEILREATLPTSEKEADSRTTAITPHNLDDSDLPESC
mmetsp:Transcript_2923/g.6795  ORF Transcript_2923/g.6795 Transcript_2923/m.6795 type:complete len:92 (+) Transcript_2923:490-765(+)